MAVGNAHRDKNGAAHGGLIFKAGVLRDIPVPKGRPGNPRALRLQEL